MDFYEYLQITPERVGQIRAAVKEELAHNREAATRDVVSAKKQREQLARERQKLLEAHYAGAVPLDMMKPEMDRLTRELHQAETTEATAKLSLSDLDRQLERALDVASHCARLYETAKPAVRRMFNQGFFKRLYVADDGSIEEAELQEPFVHLLTHDQATVVERRKARVRDMFGDGVVDVVSATPTESDESSQIDGTRWTGLPDRGEAVLLSFWTEARQSETRPKLSFGPGSNNDLLAETEGFEPPVALATLAFKASAFGRSATSPGT